jgi:hypothetical protein
MREIENHKLRTLLEIEHEKLMTFSQAAKRLPNRPHLSTLARWVSKGVRGRKLRATILGGRRFISEDSLNQFLSSLNAPDPGTTISGESHRASESRMKKAYEALTREGI